VALGARFRVDGTLDGTVRPRKGTDACATVACI
jgi:hypothetical protein